MDHHKPSIRELGLELVDRGLKLKDLWGLRQVLSVSEAS